MDAWIRQLFLYVSKLVLQKLKKLVSLFLENHIQYVLCQQNLLNTTSFIPHWIFLRMQWISPQVMHNNTGNHFSHKNQQKNIREIKFYLSKCSVNTTGKLEPIAKIMSSLCQKFANFHSIRKNFSIQQIFIPPTKGLPTTIFFFHIIIQYKLYF